MSSAKAIGGYFELELAQHHAIPRAAIALNSGRNCMEYVLKAHRVKHLHVPKFTCDVVLEPLKRLGVTHEFYSVTDQLELTETIKLQPEEMLLYTNYFGVKNEYSQKLISEYGNRLILDCSQAYFFSPSGKTHVFFSPRKFFGLPDGGILYTDKLLDAELPVAHSLSRSTHLLKRIDEGAEAGYADFKHNDSSLTGEPVQHMSPLTRRLLESIDTSAAKSARERNYAILHKSLSQSNKLAFDLAEPDGPMVYPYLNAKQGLREFLISQRVFVATYWPNVLEWASGSDLELALTTNLLPLPIDQRYDEADMKRIIGLIHEYSN